MIAGIAAAAGLRATSRRHRRRVSVGGQSRPRRGDLAAVDRLVRSVRGDGRPVAVVDHEHRLIGTLTETDDLADERMTAGQVASRARRVASPGDSAFDVASSMLEKNVDWIPVVSDGKLVGSLSRDCVLAAFGEMRAI